MRKTAVVNMRREKVGDRLLSEMPPDEWPEEYVYIGRAGHGHGGEFGNPFRKRGDLDEYERYLLRRILEDDAFRGMVAGIAGKTLVCFCKPAPCHGDVLSRAADELVTLGASFLAGRLRDKPEKPPLPSRDPDEFLLDMKDGTK